MSALSKSFYYRTTFDNFVAFVLPRLHHFVVHSELDYCNSLHYNIPGGSVTEWLACWTQAQKGPGVNRSRDAVG